MVLNTAAHQGSYKNYVVNNKSVGHDKHTHSRLMSATDRGAGSPHVWQVRN